MNISRENKDALNATLLVSVEKEDYAEQVEKVLRDYRKKARIDGFRPGMVPIGLIRKMYRKPVLVEEINKIVSEALSRYLVEEKIQILGEPMPSEERDREQDWDNQENFEFAFDLGLAPEFEFEVSGKDKVPYYEISIDKKMTDSYREDLTRRFGKFDPEETVSEESMLRVTLEEADEEGKPAENGKQVENVSVSVKQIKDKDTANLLMGKVTGDQVPVTLRKAFPNETELSSMLNLPKKELGSLSPTFLLTVEEINRFQPAELNQELFDRVFGEGQVSSEKEFEEKMKEEIARSLERESDYRFQIDAREKLIDKAKMELPSAFLKRWLLAINEGKYSPEEIEHDFLHFEKDLKWQLIRNRMVKEQDIHVSDEEVLEVAMQYTRSQFQQYGLSYLPDEEIERYAKDMLNKEDDRKRFVERKLEEKVYAFLKETVKLDRKKVNSEEFNKLFEEHKH